MQSDKFTENLCPHFHHPALLYMLWKGHGGAVGFPLAGVVGRLLPPQALPWHGASSSGGPGTCESKAILLGPLP